MKVYSPLRYPGGKGQMYQFVKELLEENDMIGCTYIEPYAGGAGIAMRLLFEDKVKKVIINDYDRSIYAVWHSIINDTDNLIRMIRDVSINIETWEIQKDIQQRKNEVDLLILGFSTFFLNRTNRSGIINAGVIGGIEQQGNYKMDCRFNKESLITLIQKIAQYKKRIEIYNLDAIDFIETVRSKYKQFYFIDPPYYKKGKQLYTNFYNHEDHLELSKYLKSKLRYKKVLLSYDNCTEIKEMYKTFNQEIRLLNYYVETKRKGEEVFITKNITIG